MAVLRGRVTDSGGPAIPGAQVQACGRTYLSSYDYSGRSTCISGTTGPEGDYLFFGTPAWGRRSATDTRNEWVTLTATAPPARSPRPTSPTTTTRPPR